MDITSDFALPKFGVARRQLSPRARVAVPETSMDEDNGLVFWKDDVRLARKIFSVEPKPISEPVEQAADNSFGLCVLAPNPRHNSASFLGAKDVGHLRNFRSSSMQPATTDATFGGTASRFDGQFQSSTRGR
jgi:hypothetical protein